MPLRPLLGRVVLYALLAGTTFAQGWSDGVISTETSVVRSSAVQSPPLPPNSTELALDSGLYTGYSSNLQNQDILPGWTYWAHSADFQPPPTAQGRLLEVRYVAAMQWGSGREFDLIIRRTSDGQTLGTLYRQSAVLDTTQWQVLDVSSLGIDVGQDAFSLEMRPSAPCGGSNGFTLAFSSSSTDGSSSQDQCASPWANRNSSAKELFLRPVIENGGPPTIQVQNPVAGQDCTIQLFNLTPNDMVWFGYSFAGPGPLASRFGLVELTPPFDGRTYLADTLGQAQATVRIPAALAGSRVWLQAIDLGSSRLSPGLEVDLL